MSGLVMADVGLHDMNDSKRACGGGFATGRRERYKVLGGGAPAVEGICSSRVVNGTQSTKGST